MSLRRIVFSVFVLFSLNAHAQASLDACLRHFSSILLPGDSFSADFHLQKQLPGLAHPLSAKGRVVAVPNQGLIWQTTFPLEEIRIFGKHRFVTTDEKGELKLQDFQASAPFAQLLTGSQDDLIKTLQQTFFISCFSKESRQSVILSPKSGTLSNYLIEIALESSDKRLTRATITQTNNAVTRIEFRNTTSPAIVTKDDAELLNRVR